MCVFRKHFILLSLLTLALAAPRAGFAELTISEIASQTTFNQSSSAQTGYVVVYLTGTGSDLTNDLFASDVVSASVSPASGSGITLGVPSISTGSYFSGDYPYIFTTSGSMPIEDPILTPYTAYLTDNSNNFDSTSGSDTVYGNTRTDDVPLPAKGVVGLMEFPFTIQPNATGVFTIALDTIPQYFTDGMGGAEYDKGTQLYDPEARTYPDSLNIAYNSPYATSQTTPTFGPALSISVVPEPSTLMLAAIATGGGMFWGCRRWRTNRAAV